MATFQIGNINLINNILSYLTLNDVIVFSFTSKNNYSLVHNHNNNLTNFLWLKQCEDTFYENIISKLKYEYINNKHTLNLKYIYIMILNTKDDIVSILGNEHAEFIFDAFYTHQYIPPIRKNNNALENLFLSLHQNYFLEKESECNFFSKKDSNISAQFLNSVINKDSNENEILTLIVNNELTNARIINILNNYLQYNRIILFLVLVIKLTKLMCVFHVNKLRYLKYTCSSKEFVNEFIESHNAFIQTSLMINEKYYEINNYVNNSEHIKSSRASLYELLFRIWKHEVYLILENEINTSINNVMPDFINEMCTNNNSMSFEDDYSFNDEITTKELIERISSCILDFSIDDKNIKYINHTAIPLSKEYLSFENIITKAIISSLTKNQGIKIDTITQLDNFINDELNLIPHSKLTILNNVVSSLKDYLIDNIENDFNIFLDSSTTTSTSTTETNYSFDNNDTSGTNIINNYIHIENKQVKIKLQEELDMICGYLQQNVIHNDCNCEQAMKFIKGRNNYVAILKQVIISYYETIFKFENMNEDVVINIDNEKEDMFGKSDITVSNSLCKCKEYEIKQDYIIGNNLGLDIGKGIGLDNCKERKMLLFK